MNLSGANHLSPFNGPANETLASRIADQLKRWIITGQFKPGQKLVEKDPSIL